MKPAVYNRNATWSKDMFTLVVRLWVYTIIRMRCGTRHGCFGELLTTPGLPVSHMHRDSFKDKQIPARTWSHQRGQLYSFSSLLTISLLVFYLRGNHF